MPMTREQIFAEAKALDAGDREILAEEIWQTIEPHEFTAEQIAELRRRVAEVESGQAELLDGKQVLADLRKRLPQ